MKRTFIFGGLIILLSITTQAQEIKVHNFIGKAITEVSAFYGKPVHQDNSNPDMVCTFYRLPNRNYTFVSDVKGVYQANATITYNTKDESKKAIDVFLKDCLSNDYTVDTISTEKYKLRRQGNKMELNLSPIANSENFQIIIEAKKSDD